MDLRIKAAMDQHNKLHNTAIDWLIASWSRKSEAEKNMCIFNYEKYSLQAQKVAVRLEKLTKEIWEQ